MTVLPIILVHNSMAVSSHYDLLMVEVCFLVPCLHHMPTIVSSGFIISASSRGYCVSFSEFTLPIQIHSTSNLEYKSTIGPSFHVLYL